MSAEVEREILAEINAHKLGLPISGHQLARKLGRSPDELFEAAQELERKMRIGRYIFTMAEEYSGGVRTDFLMSLEESSNQGEGIKVTLRIAGPQNFDEEQTAAIASILQTLKSRGYDVNRRRQFTASAGQSALELIALYVAGRTEGKITDKVLDELFKIVAERVKRLSSKVRRRVVIVDEETNETLRDTEISDDEPGST